MSYINEITLEYPITEREIKARHTEPTSWATPFKAKPPHRFVFPTPQPEVNSISHYVTEGQPVLSSKGEFEQTWVINEHTPETVTANIAQKKAALIDAATQKRWEVETGGLTLGNGIKLATDTSDQNRITTVIANAQLAGVETVSFKAESGWVTLTIAEVQGIAAAIALHVQNCFNIEMQQHAEIDALETVEDVTDYVIGVLWAS